MLTSLKYLTSLELELKESLGLIHISSGFKDLKKLKHLSLYFDTIDILDQDIEDSFNLQGYEDFERFEINVSNFT